MPLLPIDLQTMFSQMSQIGREQAVQKDIPPQHQFAQGAEIVKKTEHDDKAVNLAREPSEGPEKVKEEKARGERQKPSGGGARAREARPETRKDVFEDPDLGHHVNIVG